MNTRTLANSDLSVSHITFGAWAIGGWMWGGNDDQEALEALKACLDVGITTIDTAPIYGMGHSETLVGKALKAHRHEVQLLTKCGLKWDGQEGEYYFESQDNSGKPVNIYRNGKKESIIQECEDSLRRLQTDYIDLYQLHWPDKTTPIEETMEALALLKQQGKVRQVGVCNYSLEQFQKGLETAPLVSDQVPFSMVLRKNQKDLMPWCAQHGKSVIAYSPLQRGVLTGKYTDTDSLNEGDHRKGNKFFSATNLPRINAFLGDIKPHADDLGLSLAQLVLAWTAAQPAVDCVLAGGRNAQQVKENARAGQVTLEADVVSAITLRLDELELAED